MLSNQKIFSSNQQILQKWEKFILYFLLFAQHFRTSLLKYAALEMSRLWCHKGHRHLPQSGRNTPGRCLLRNWLAATRTSCPNKASLLAGSQKPAFLLEAVNIGLNMLFSGDVLCFGIIIDARLVSWSLEWKKENGDVFQNRYEHKDKMHL